MNMIYVVRKAQWKIDLIWWYRARFRRGLSCPKYVHLRPSTALDWTQFLVLLVSRCDLINSQRILYKPCIIDGHKTGAIRNSFTQYPFQAVSNDFPKQTTLYFKLCSSPRTYNSNVYIAGMFYTCDQTTKRRSNIWCINGIWML